MTMQYVQFSDSTETLIVSWSAGPQDPAIYGNLGQVEEDDPRYLAYLSPPPDVLAIQSVKLQVLTQLAAAQKSALTNRIATLQDAIDNVGVEGREEFAATPEEQIEFPNRKTQLIKWKDYAILLGRVASQSGWPPEVVWPVQPAQGMDLTVSASAPETI